TILIPPDNSKNKFKLVNDIFLYLSKRSNECKVTDALFLECVRKKGDIKKEIWYQLLQMGANKLKNMLHQIALNTGIKLDDCKITNYSARRSAIMIFKAANIPEDELMNFSGHRSREGIRLYSKPTDDQQLNSTTMLIPNATVDDNLEEFYSYLVNCIPIMNQRMMTITR
ncbi:23961_t:CDS:1, partial [Gigaspora margarita]